MPLKPAAFVAVPQIAQAQTTSQQPNTAETTTQTFGVVSGENAILVEPGSDFSVDTEIGNGVTFNMGGVDSSQGAEGVTYNATSSSNTITAAGHGIVIPASTAEFDITNTGKITAGASGVVITYPGAFDAAGYTNSVSVTTGDIDAGVYGVVADHLHTNGNLTINTGDIESGNSGVYVNQHSGNVNDGPSDITVNTGSITSSSGRGVHIEDNGRGDIEVTTGGDVNTNLEGVYVHHNNVLSDGDITIDTSAGNVAASGASGIRVWSNSTGDIDVTTGGVRGVYGIWISSENDADITVDAKGTVEGTSGYGIDVYNTNGLAYDNDITINTGDVKGTTYGIYANNTTNGDVIIDTTANAQPGLKSTVRSAAPGTAGDYDGIYASSYGSIDITASNVYGDDHGIHALTQNTGTTDPDRINRVTVDGTVTGHWDAGSIYQQGFTAIETNIEDGGLVYHLNTNGSEPSDTDVTTYNAIYADGWSTLPVDVNIKEGGEVRGNIINVSEGVTTVTNEGIWNNTGGTSNFYDYTSQNSFHNEETGAYIAAHKSSTATTTLLNAGNVYNAGDIVMQNGDSRVLGNPETPAPNAPNGGIVGDVVNFAGSTYHSQGGRLLVDVDLANGPGTGQASDVLHVGNAVTDHDIDYSDPSNPIDNGPLPTSVELNIVNGWGQPAEDVLVVQVDGTSDADAFVLGKTKGGLYKYSLEQALNDKTPTESWYLQTRRGGAGAAVQAMGSLASGAILASVGNLNDRRGAVHRKNDTAADIRHRRRHANVNLSAESSNFQLASYGNNNSSFSGAYRLAALESPAKLDTAESRGIVNSLGKGNAHAAWARIFGQSDDYRSRDDAALSMNGRTWGVQVGTDVINQTNLNGGGKTAGVYFAYANSRGDSSIEGDNGTDGRVKMDATSIGAYYNRFSKNETYLDLVAQYTWLSDVRVQTEDGEFNTKGTGYALSAEVGKQFSPIDARITHELQAQLIYQGSHFNSLTSDTGDDISSPRNSGLIGRLGYLVAANRTDIRPWARFNVWHDFGRPYEVESLGATESARRKGTSGEVEAGFNKPINDSTWGFFGSAGYKFRLSGATQKGWRGTIGLNKAW